MPSDPSARPAPDDDPAERPVILLVGQDEGLREELRARIERAYRVAEAESGPDALAYAREEPPDLILADVSLPDVDSIALLAQLRDEAATQHVPVVLLSAGSGHHPAGDVLGLAAGVAGLVTDWEPLLHAPASAIGPPLDLVDRDFLDAVDAAIGVHMASPAFGPRALAEAVALSPRQVRRRLAELTGESPTEYVRRVRLARAAEMLREGDPSVKAVASAVGFASTSGFRAAFREAYGASPSEYGPSPAAP